MSDMNKKDGVELSITGDVAIVTFHAVSISNYNDIAAASKQISEFVETNKPNRIVVDFEQVKFFSSEVLGVILNIRSKLQEDNGEVVISGIDPQLYRIFRITNLDKIFRFFPDKQQALEVLNN